MLAPEYGGDGGKKAGACVALQPPVAAFPAHWAPNDLKIYKGRQFPRAYRGGAFIAFHGSWNRAPGPQGGYNIVFQALAGGKPSGDYIVFADGFAGDFKDPGKAAHRPSGLAVGPDGALYVSDDVTGRIWRITFAGDPNTKGLEAVPAPNLTPQLRRSHRFIPGGNVAGPSDAAGFNAGTVALGKRIFAARCEVRRAPGVTAPTPSARRSGPISPVANGCGATGALRASGRR